MKLSERQKHEGRSWLNCLLLSTKNHKTPMEDDEKNENECGQTKFCFILKPKWSKR